MSKSIDQLAKELDAPLSIDERLTIAHSALDVVAGLELGTPGYMADRSLAMTVAFKAVASVGHMGHTARSFLASKGSVEPEQIDLALAMFQPLLDRAIPIGTPGLKMLEGTKIYTSAIFTRLEYIYSQLQKRCGFRLLSKKDRVPSTGIRYNQKVHSNNVVSLDHWKGSNDATRKKETWTAHEQNDE